VRVRSEPATHPSIAQQVAWSNAGLSGADAIGAAVESYIADNPVSVLSGASTLTLATPRREHSETVAAVGVTTLNRVVVDLAPADDANENDPEMTDLVSLSARAGTDTITFTVCFSELTSGPINLIWSAV
jgi:hypothetical protein